MTSINTGNMVATLNIRRIKRLKLRNKYNRSLVKKFKKTMSFRQTELLSSTDKNG